MLQRTVVRRAAVLLVALAIVPATMSCREEQPRRPVALVYGDGFAVEAGWAYLRGVDSWRVIVKAEPSWAICDMVKSFRRDIRRYRPEVIVVETLGDNSQCMGAAVSDDQYFTKFADGLRTITEGAEGAELVFELPPTTFPSGLTARIARLTTIAREHGFRISATARDAVGGDTVALTAPCRPVDRRHDACSGESVAIRAPDRVHFCPVPYESYWAFFNGCPVWSSGAHRYGQAMLQSIEAVGD